MTTARADPGRGPRSGFTLIEMILVMFLLAAVLGLVITTIVRAQRRFRRAARAAEARAEIARAAERILKDIRGARGAHVTKENGALVLVRPDGERIEWRLREGRLVRTAPEDEFVSRARPSGFRVKIEEEAGRSPFVEVGLELDGRPAPVFYVGAVLRSSGEGGRAGGAKR